MLLKKNHYRSLKQDNWIGRTAKFLLKQKKTVAAWAFDKCPCSCFINGSKKQVFSTTAGQFTDFMYITDFGCSSQSCEMMQ